MCTSACPPPNTGASRSSSGRPARGLARVYASLAAGGDIDGVHVVAAPLLQAAAQEHSNGPDRVLQRPSRFGIGFQLTQPERPLGPTPAPSATSVPAAPSASAIPRPASPSHT